MKVLHIFPKSDNMIVQHVNMLKEGMAQSVNLVDSNPDIIHCHGCWDFNVAKAIRTARKHNARLVLTPHGQLEPWILSERRLSEKMSKTILWQRRVVASSYAVIALGKLEQENLMKLGWNTRIEVIHNAVITNTTTPQEMCKQTFMVYQKVMDSNVLEYMDEPSLELLSNIIKASITGDRRWGASAYVPPTVDWRNLFTYAAHQNIRNYVDYGISTLGISAPSIDTTKIESYFPNGYTLPQPIHTLIGDYQGDETSYIVSMIRQIHKQPLLLHLIELSRELRRDTVNDAKICEALEEEKLTKYASSLMTILADQTGLEEGFMPLSPSDDKVTNHIRKQITDHLKI